jgi:hypothetical protein
VKFTWISQGSKMVGDGMFDRIVHFFLRQF